MCISLFCCILAGGNELYWPTDGDNENAKMLGFRAWFQINGSAVSGMPVHRDMPAMLRIVSTPTGTENIKPAEDSIHKELRNGQIIIIKNGVKYSITGQRL